jgi:hypothetical protein
MPCDNETGSVFMADGSEVSYDGLPSISFQCSFSKLPNTMFFLQRWNVPGVSVGKVTRPTPFLDIDEIGEKMIFEQFTIEFLIDKQLKNYKEIFDWMKRITVNASQRDEVGDASIIIAGSKMVRFIDVWPASLSGMEFSTNATNVDYLKCTATFNYDWYEFTNV